MNADKKGLEDYAQLLQSYEGSPIAIDIAHSALLWGTILSMKPKKVLELGIGTGFTSKTILAGLKYNGIGKLTCVDNWYDNNFNEPPIAQELRDLGANIVEAPEDMYLRNFCLKEKFDIVVSDADHYRSHEWLTLYVYITNKDGVIFFHDVCSSDFPGLHAIQPRLERAGLPCKLFAQSSQRDERCERGWLMVFNRKL